LKILHTIAGVWSGTGGPVASVTSLCRELASRGHEVCLLTGEGPLHPAVEKLADHVRVRLARLGPYRLAHWSKEFRRACREEARWADIVHDHGVWLYTDWSSAGAAAEAARPLVRSPRGMLSPWALSRSKLRKRLLWALIERRLFAGAAVVHATSELEEREIKSLGLACRVAVVPNGIDTEVEYALERVLAARDAEAFGSGSRRRIVFLSRLHPKKGLDLLQEAWATFPGDLPAELLIAGAGDEDCVADLRSWIERQPGPPVRYLGPVHGDEKLRLLASAWAFVLPSRSENYGMAVAEALACGTPVLTTTETPWKELPARGCGWIVPPRAPELIVALREALAVGENAHTGMRERARLYIEAEHSLRATGARFEAIYSDLAGGRGAKPR